MLIHLFHNFSATYMAYTKVKGKKVTHAFKLF